MKCRRCYKESYDRRLCPKCEGEWQSMRTRGWEAAKARHGELTQTSLPKIQADMKRIVAMIVSSSIMVLSENEKR